jgi:hypothetical protein
MNKLIKPNTLVYVNLRDTLGYAFIGEVMSFEVPPVYAPCSQHTKVDGSCHDCAMNTVGPTAMVRRVPGHPGTLVELPVSCLAAVNKADCKYIHYAIVNSRTERDDPMFPVDMLRYDCAAPVNFTIRADDYHGTIASIADSTFGWGAERVVATVSKHRDPARAFCRERWGSFLRSIRHIATEVL